MKRFLYVFEYADDGSSTVSDALWNIPQKILSKRLENKNKPVEFNFARGLFHKYTKNGTSLIRLVNFIWMHISALFVLMFYRPDFVFVRTTPPMIQITYSILGNLFGAKVYIWLMDYHPVFESRICGENLIKKFIVGLFDRLDRFGLSKVDAVVCLDQAMEELIKSRFVNVRTVVCPTFALGKSIFTDLRKVDPDTISLLYSGNLGIGHNLKRFERFIKKLSAKKRVIISYCGNSHLAQDRFSKLCVDAGAEFKKYPFVKDYSKLGSFYKENGFDYGVVLLNDELKGVVSPSKFTGYTSFGLPIISITPKGTNSDFVCKKFGAGISINEESDLDAAIDVITESRIQTIFAANTRFCLNYFGQDAIKNIVDFFENEINNI